MVLLLLGVPRARPALDPALYRLPCGDEGPIDTSDNNSGVNSAILFTARPRKWRVGKEGQIPNVVNVLDLLKHFPWLWVSTVAGEQHPVLLCGGTDGTGKRNAYFSFPPELRGIFAKMLGFDRRNGASRIFSVRFMISRLCFSG